MKDSLESLVPGQFSPPRTVIVLYQRIWDFLLPGLVREMRARYGTRFILIAPSPPLIARCESFCAEDDRVLLLSALEDAAAAGPTDADAVFAQARENEHKYGVTYMRDLIQQMRGSSAAYLTHAPASAAAGTRPPPLVEQFKVLNNHFACFEKMIREENIDLIIARPDICPLTAALTHAAMGLGVPVTYCKAIRYEAYLTWSLGPYNQHDLLEEVCQHLTLPAPVPWRALEPPAGSDLRWRQAIERYSLRMTLTNLLKHAIDRVHLKFKDLRAGRRKVHRLRYWRGITHLINGYRVSRYLQKVSESDIGRIKARRYVLFLLPQEPEFAVQSLAREFAHTFTVIQQLALSIPADHNLVIKEHALIGNRRLSFYRDIMRLPNVICAHTLIRGIDLARESAAVATMAGTNGLEASLIGKQVILFGKHVEYKFLPNVHEVSSFHDLPAIIAGALLPRSQVAVEDARRCAARLRDAAVELSFSAPGTAPFNDDIATMEPDQVERAVDVLMVNYRFQRQAVASGAPAPAVVTS